MERRGWRGEILRKIFFNGLELGAERAEGVENNFGVTERRRIRFEREGNEFRLLVECTHVQVGV